MLPQYRSLFVLSNPAWVTTANIAWVRLFTSSTEMVETLKAFPGVTGVNANMLHMGIVDFFISPNYDYEEVWLLLCDALTLRAAEIEADKRFDEVWGNAL